MPPLPTPPTSSSTTPPTSSLKPTDHTTEAHTGSTWFSMDSIILVLKLAAPLCVVHAGYHITGLVDAAIAGRHSQLAIAAAGMGASIFFAFGVFGIGLCLGLDPMAAQAFGAKKPELARSGLWQGFYLATAVSVPLAGLIYLLGYQFENLGVDSALAETTRHYLFARIPAIFPLLLAVTARSYLQAAKIIRPIVWAAIWTNIFNGFADWILLFGDAGLLDLGLPAMGLKSFGVAGLGWASVVAQVAQFAVLALALKYHKKARIFGRDKFCKKQTLQLIRYGWPIGLHLFVEVGVFSAVQLLMGGMGVVESAAHQVAVMWASLTFAVCLGVASATTVEVGRAVGAKNPLAARRAGFSGIMIGMTFMLLSGGIMLTAPQMMAHVMTRDPEVVALAVSLLGIAGLFQLADGIQAVAGGALRGKGITQWSFIANLLGHWGVGLPLGLYLAFTLGQGAPGLWWGISSGLVVVAVALTWKFNAVSRADISVVGVTATVDMTTADQTT